MFRYRYALSRPVKMLVVIFFLTLAYKIFAPSPCYYIPLELFGLIRFGPALPLSVPGLWSFATGLNLHF